MRAGAAVIQDGAWSMALNDRLGGGRRGCHPDSAAHQEDRLGAQGGDLGQASAMPFLANRRQGSPQVGQLGLHGAENGDWWDRGSGRHAYAGTWSGWGLVTGSP